MTSGVSVLCMHACMCVCLFLVELAIGKAAAVSLSLDRDPAPWASGWAPAAGQEGSELELLGQAAADLTSLN